MYIGPGDTIEGNDGRKWIVCAVDHQTREVTLWNAERGVWTGKPSGSPKILKLANEDKLSAEAIHELLKIFPGVERLYYQNKRPT